MLPETLPTLTDGRVTLRAFSERDAALVQSVASNPLIPLVTTVPRSGARSDALAYIERADSLRRILTDWDPAGAIRAGAPDDEYDCMIALLTDLVHKGADCEFFNRVLREELEEHFGIEPDADSLTCARQLEQLAEIHAEK